MCRVSEHRCSSQGEGAGHPGVQGPAAGSAGHPKHLIRCNAVEAEAPSCHLAGRGRQVIAVCKSADLLLMVLDASKPHAHRKILTAELEAVGIRLNRRPPSIYFKKKKTGGISFNATIPLTRMDEKLCHRILQVRRGGGGDSYLNDMHWLDVEPRGRHES